MRAPDCVWPTCRCVTGGGCSLEVAPGEPPVRPVVAMLEHLLTEARAGRLAGLGVVVLHSSGTGSTGFHGNDVQLAAGCHALLGRLTRGDPC